MLTDKILKGINKAWGAGEGDALKVLMDKYGFSHEEAAKALDLVGPKFIYQGGLLWENNPQPVDTEEKLLELIAEMSKEFTPTEMVEELGAAARMSEKMWELKQRTIDNAFTEAKRLGIDLRDLGFEFDEYDPNTHQVDPNSEGFLALRQQVRTAGEVEGMPAARREWKEQWGVPESEWEGWAERPLVHPSEARSTAEQGAQGWYSPKTGEIVAPPHPSTIAHEMAHSGYFEDMPPAMRAIYPWTHQLAQRINPQYREAVGSYAGKIPGTDISKGTLPTEGYATAYQHLGKQPEQMPWYKEPFYGNLMYPVPEGQDTTFRWLLNWAMDKYRKWQQEKQGTWSPPMPEEEVKRLLHSGGVKDMDWNTLAAEQKKKGGGWSGGGAKPELL